MHYCNFNLCTFTIKHCWKFHTKQPSLFLDTQFSTITCHFHTDHILKLYFYNSVFSFFCITFWSGLQLADTYQPWQFRKWKEIFQVLFDSNCEVYNSLCHFLREGLSLFMKQNRIEKCTLWDKLKLVIFQEEICNLWIRTL